MRQYLAGTKYFLECLENLIDKLKVKYKHIKDLFDIILSLINAKYVENKELNIVEYDQKIISYIFLFKRLNCNENIIRGEW